MESNNDNNRLEELLRKMYAEEDLYAESTEADMIDEEWAKYKKAHFRSSPLQQAKQILRLHKIAAMLISVLMLSGIAYAAIRIVQRNADGDIHSPSQKEIVSNQSLQKNVGQPVDSTTMQPVVFEDAELESILHEVATFYQCETVYKNERVKHVRLYFTWDKTARIDEVVETCNKFERFHITRENRRLIVE